MTLRWFTGVAQMTNDSSANPWTEPEMTAGAVYIGRSRAEVQAMERRVPAESSYYRMVYNFGVTGPFTGAHCERAVSTCTAEHCTAEHCTALRSTACGREPLPGTTAHSPPSCPPTNPFLPLHAPVPPAQAPARLGT